MKIVDSKFEISNSNCEICYKRDKDLKIMFLINFDTLKVDAKKNDNYIERLIIILKF